MDDGACDFCGLLLPAPGAPCAWTDGDRVLLCRQLADLEHSALIIDRPARAPRPFVVVQPEPTPAPPVVDLEPRQGVLL